MSIKYHMIITIGAFANQGPGDPCPMKDSGKLYISKKPGELVHYLRCSEHPDHPLHRTPLTDIQANTLLARLEELGTIIPPAPAASA